MKRPTQSRLAAGVLAVTAGFASFATAGPFEPSRVPKDATWVLHVDTEIVFQSNMWDIFQQAMDDTSRLRMVAGLELLHDFTGVDLQRDLHDVTLYGHGFEPSSAVIVLHGSWDPAALAGVIQNAKNYDVVDHGTHAVHRWTDDRDGKTKYGSFIGNDVIVVGESEKAVDGALDVFDDATHLAMSPADGPTTPPAGSGLMAFVTADGVDALRESGRARSPIFSRIKAGWISMTEADSMLTLHGNVEATSAAGAKQLMNAVQGIKSFAAVTVGDDAKPAQRRVVGLLDQATAAVDNDHVVLDWPIPLDSLSQLAKEIAAERGDTTKPTTQP